MNGALDPFAGGRPERVDIQRRNRVVLRIVDGVVRGAVDDHAGTHLGHRRADTGVAGDVEIGAGQRHNLVLRREHPRHRPAELSNRRSPRSGCGSV